MRQSEIHKLIKAKFIFKRYFEIWDKVLVFDSAHSILLNSFTLNSSLMPTSEEMDGKIPMHPNVTTKQLTDLFIYLSAKSTGQLSTLTGF